MSGRAGHYHHFNIDAVKLFMLSLTYRSGIPLVQAEVRQGLLDDRLEAARAVIAIIDEDKLAHFVAAKNPEEGPGAKAKSQALEAQKEALTQALTSIAEALMERGQVSISQTSLLKS